MTSSNWTAIVGSSGALADSAIHVNLVVFLKSCGGKVKITLAYSKKCGLHAITGCSLKEGDLIDSTCASGSRWKLCLGTYKFSLYVNKMPSCIDSSQPDWPQTGDDRRQKYQRVTVKQKLLELCSTLLSRCSWASIDVIPPEGFLLKGKGQYNVSFLW